MLTLQNFREKEISKNRTTKVSGGNGEIRLRSIDSGNIVIECWDANGNLLWTRDILGNDVC